MTTGGCSFDRQQGFGRRIQAHRGDSGFQTDGHHDPTWQIEIPRGMRAKGRQVWAPKEGHSIASCSPRGSWYINCGQVHFPQSFRHAPSQTRRLVTQLAANCQRTYMSSATLHRSANGGSRPRLVISTHDGAIWRLAYLPDGRRIVTGSEGGSVKVLERGGPQGRVGTGLQEEEERWQECQGTRPGNAGTA